MASRCSEEKTQVLENLPRAGPRSSYQGSFCFGHEISSLVLCIYLPSVPFHWMGTAPHVPSSLSSGANVTSWTCRARLCPALTQTRFLACFSHLFFFSSNLLSSPKKSCAKPQFAVVSLPCGSSCKILLIPMNFLEALMEKWLMNRWSLCHSVLYLL